LIIGGVLLVVKSVGQNEDFSYISLLDTYSRIIQKPTSSPIKIINVERIDTSSKRRNILAFESLKEDIRNKFFKDYNLYYNLDIWSNLYNELNELLLNFAINSFNSYLDEIKSKDRYIYATDTDDKILIELDNRYCKSYQKKIERRAKYLSWFFRKSKSVLLTLTLDPSKYSDDKFKMWIDIKKQYNRFITAVKYYFKKQNIKFPPYICTIEAQKNGNPHLHICFLGASRLMDWRKLTDLWGLGHIWINISKDKRIIRNQIRYIIKYITKNYTDTNEENRLTQSLCWLFNIRSYQCSRGLITPLKPTIKSLYNSEYLIVVKDKFYSLFLSENLDLFSKMVNSFNPYQSEYYKKITKLIKKYN
jgi:hypothetical protein